MSLWMAASPVGHWMKTRRYQAQRFQVTFLFSLSILWFGLIFYGTFYTQILNEHPLLLQTPYLSTREQHKVGVLTAFQPYEEGIKMKTSSSMYYNNDEEGHQNGFKLKFGREKSTVTSHSFTSLFQSQGVSHSIWRKFRENFKYTLSPETVDEKSEPSYHADRILSTQKKDFNDYVELTWTTRNKNTTKIIIVPGKRTHPPHKGEFGQPVLINPNMMSQHDLDIYEHGWKTHHFNEFASLQISFQREVPDFRNDRCLEEADRKDETYLPKASIIICLYNEAWSVLVRTIYSILTRSPAYLLQEIILVDDSSDLETLREPLQQFVASVDKLRLLRMRNRSGLVRARLAGTREAKGSILIFLDSHVECQKGWLQPLLVTIAKNPTYAVTPEIDVIDHKLFSIHRATDNIGVLDFKTFSFKWTSTLPRIKKTLKSQADPIPSPTMAGGIFAIRKDFFVSLGMYDPELQLWGGENIELSLKLWMCGGGILIQPCSRVSHIFRDTSPYLKEEKVQVAVNNAARVAYVWADDFRKFFFKDIKFKDTGIWHNVLKNVGERMQLRETLKCKMFSWYLDNVYPELHVEGSGQFVGQIKSSSGLCINERKSSLGSPVFLDDCLHAVSWEYSRLREIRTLDKCMSLKGNRLYTRTCDLQTNSQLFHYTKDKILYCPVSRLCLTVDEDDVSIVLRHCHGRQSQQWEWSKNKDYIPYHEEQIYHYSHEKGL